MMTSMNVSLPEGMKQFVEEQVEKGDFSTPSEYVRALIRQAQAQAERRALEANGGRPLSHRVKTRQRQHSAELSA